MRAYFAPGSWQHGELVADDENTPNTDAAHSQFAACALPRTPQFFARFGESAASFVASNASNEASLQIHNFPRKFPPQHLAGRPQLRSPGSAQGPFGALTADTVNATSISGGTLSRNAATLALTPIPR